MLSKLNKERLTIILIVIALFSVLFYPEVAKFFKKVTLSFAMRVPTEVRPQSGGMLNGKREGEWTRYHPNGQLESIWTYKNGMAFGPYVMYDQEGNLLAEGVMPDGVIKEYDPQRGTSREYEVKNYKCTGMLRKYTRGQLKTEMTCDYHEPATPHGIYRVYHDNGKLSFERYYAYGKEDGPLYQYAENGQLIAVTNYKQDLPHGPYERYADKGQLIERGVYENGIKVKEEQYDDKGVLHSTYQK